MKKKYIGTKQVTAETCSLGDFIQLTGRNPYANSKDMHGNNEPGYLVEYEDSYKSWSPKDVFEKAYKCSETFLDRLRIELNELLDKQDKLRAFFGTDTYKSLPDLDRALLEEQLCIMLKYSSILSKRIAAVESK